MVVRDRDTVVSRLGSFQDNVTANLAHPRVLPSAAKDIEQDGPPRRRAEASCDQQDLIADKVKANSVRPRPIEKERGRRFKNILAQLVPRVGLGKDAFSKTFGSIAAVRFLEDLKHQFRHTSMIRRAFAIMRRAVPRRTPLERIGKD